VFILLQIVSGKSRNDSRLFGNKYQVARIVWLDQIGHFLKRQDGKHLFKLNTAGGMLGPELDNTLLT
jgi:hypothetical protein